MCVCGTSRCFNLRQSRERPVLLVDRSPVEGQIPTKRKHKQLGNIRLNNILKFNVLMRMRQLLEAFRREGLPLFHDNNMLYFMLLPT